MDLSDGRQVIQQHQVQRLRQMLQVVLPTNRFYQKKFGQQGLSNVASLEANAQREDHSIPYGDATALFRRFAEGLTAGADAQFTNRCLEESGVSDAERSSIIAYGAGNGIGLDLVEKPLLGADRGVTIRDGMILTLRVCLQGRQCGSALISRPYRVTSRGLELLVSEGEELVTVAA